MPIQTAKLINNGNNQQGDNLIISPKKTMWDAFFDSPSAFDEDFLTDREDTIPQDQEF